MVNEHDVTKKMLDTMRNRVTIITENQEVQTTKPPAIPEPISNDSNKEIYVVKDGKKEHDGLLNYFNDDSKEFMSRIPDVTFYNYRITPREGTTPGDVMMSGKLNALGIEFTMNKEDDLGLRIKTPIDVKLTNDAMETLRKLMGYFENWQKEWAIKLNEENFSNV
jgi:hypothetical protein